MKQRPYLLEAIAVLFGEILVFVFSQHHIFGYIAFTMFLFLFFTKGLFSRQVMPSEQFYSHFIAWFVSPLVFIINIFACFVYRNNFKYIRKKWAAIAMVKSYKSLCNIPQSWNEYKKA